jgi:hypothetical protein
MPLIVGGGCEWFAGIVLYEMSDNHGSLGFSCGVSELGHCL